MIKLVYEHYLLISFNLIFCSMPGISVPSTFFRVLLDHLNPRPHQFALFWNFEDHNVLLPGIWQYREHHKMERTYDTLIFNLYFLLTLS